MSTDLEDAMLVGAVQASTAEARNSLDDHPTTDELLAYHEGGLEDDSAERLREHLALCPACAQRALDLAKSSRELPGEDDRASTTAAQAWQATRQALAQEGLLGGARPVVSKAGERRWGVLDFMRSPRLAYAAAAAFFLSTVGLSLRLADIRRPVAEQPRANVRLVDLHPLGEGGQRTVGSPPPVVVSEPGEDTLLILNLLDPGSFSVYRVEILDSQDRIIWNTAELRWSPGGHFTVFLPQRLMTSERLSLRLHGVDGRRTVLLAEYALAFAAQ